MPFATATIAGTAALVGAGASVFGTVQSMGAAKEAAAASRQAEDLRKKQMELDTARKTRELIRETQGKQSSALQSAVNAGAQYSSVTPGAQGQLEGAFRSNVQALNENASIGASLFEANSNLADAQASAKEGDAISKIGSTLFANSENIGKIGSSIGSTVKGSWETNNG